MRTLITRLERLEATSTPPGRVVPIWAYGRDRDDIAAEVEALKRAGGMTDHDHLYLITWMDSVESAA